MILGSVFIHVLSSFFLYLVHIADTDGTKLSCLVRVGAVN